MSVIEPLKTIKISSLINHKYISFEFKKLHLNNNSIINAQLKRYIESREKSEMLESG